MIKYSLQIQQYGKIYKVTARANIPVKIGEITEYDYITINTESDNLNDIHEKVQTRLKILVAKEKQDAGN